MSYLKILSFHAAFSFPTLLFLASCGQSSKTSCDELLRHSVDKANSGDWGAAQSLADKAASGSPAMPLALIMSGLALDRAGSSEKAVERYAKALRIDPGNSLASLLLGRLYLDMEKPKLAYQYLLDAHASNPDAPETLKLLCRSAMALNHSDAPTHLEALAKTTDVIDKAYAFNELGVFSAKRKDVKQAQKYFIEAVKTDPKNSSAILNMAVILDSKSKPGNIQMAVKLYQRYLEVAKSNPALKAKADAVNVRIRKLEGAVQTPKPAR